MRLYVLRLLGVSRREAALMPRWEREALIDQHNAVAISVDRYAPHVSSRHGVGDFSADDLALMGGI